MEERPILFSTPMVQAILVGRKSQTRRIVKFSDDFDGKKVFDNSPFGLKYSKSDDTLWRFPCKHGQIGDILWVRETYQKIEGDRFIYKADPIIWGGKWKPSIFMPKAASRIKLEIINIRVERVQDISEKDAINEGAELKERTYGSSFTCDSCKTFHGTAKLAYQFLWESINGKDSWSKNPWVWVIEFKKL